MKKTFLGVAATLLCSAAVYFVSTTSSKSDPMADLLIANVEALAQGEGSSVPYCDNVCIPSYAHYCDIYTPSDSRFCPHYLYW